MSRFSTPVSDLDDHRRQHVLTQRADTGGSLRGSRRPTFASIEPLHERSNVTVQVNETHDNGVTSRDFESAIAEDDEHLTPDNHFIRRGSMSASPVGRRDTFRRPRDPAIERLTRSRASSTSSRSVSPPNSVDAFAGPIRRDRAGTVNSRPPSITELAIHRTISGGTRRRPTISDERPQDLGSAAASTHSSAEEDVCFPVQEDPGKTTRFDYEELEEFVAEYHQKTPIAQTLRHKPSSVSQLSKKVFNDLRPKSSHSTGPKGEVDAATLMDAHDPAVAEKLVSALSYCLILCKSSRRCDMFELSMKDLLEIRDYLLLAFAPVNCC